jgi:hypothetical protein
MIASTVGLFAGQPAFMADFRRETAQGSIKVVFAAIVESLLIGLFACLPPRFTVRLQFV